MPDCGLHLSHVNSEFLNIHVLHDTVESDVHNTENSIETYSRGCGGRCTA